MIKLLGSLCIFGGGVLAWWYQSAERHRRLDVLSDLLAALRRMAEEIRQTRTPLPVLLDRLQAGRKPDTAAFFRTVTMAARRGEPVSPAWRQAARALPLNEEDRFALEEMGDSLHGDEESICKVISLVTKTLSDSLEEARRRRPDQEKRATALCFSAAALLVILLI